MEFRDKDFNGEEVTLDDNTFTGCTFRNCTVIYRGSSKLHVSGNRFLENVKWKLDGPAAATVQFLAAVYNGMGEGGRDLVENTFKQIRGGKK
jgi:hypothetical protein